MYDGLTMVLILLLHTSGRKFFLSIVMEILFVSRRQKLGYGRTYGRRIA